MSNWQITQTYITTHSQHITTVWKLQTWSDHYVAYNYPIRLLLGLNFVQHWKYNS